jgi:hypothetical protein
MRYDVHPGVAMIARWLEDLPEKTGRTRDEWVAVVQRIKLKDSKSKREHLKTHFGLGTMGAMWLVEYAEGQPTWDGDEESYLTSAERYVESQYTGAKASLKPIFDGIVAFVRTLGPDVKVCPCKTIVPFYRHRVFAELKAATNTRLELAMALGETPIKGKMKPNPRAKGNDRLKHLFELYEWKDFTNDVKAALQRAYTLDP